MEEGLQQMIRTGKLVRVAYPWEHDRLGRINLRASGLLIEDTRTLLRLTGYCQQVSAPAEQETREHSYEGAEEANHDR